MGKLMDDLQGRYLGVDENLEYDALVAGADPAKLKLCLICGKSFVAAGRKAYCDRQHYTTCVKCGGRLDIIDKYFRAGFVPKTCSKACADQIGVETYKQNFMDKYGVTNPMYVQEFAEKAVINARPKIPEGKSFAPETRTCVICGSEFTRPHVSPTQCCSSECSTKLRKQTTAKYKLCELCGKPFIATTSRAKYCDGAHYRLCVICGEPFKLSRPTSTAKVCSDACKDKLTHQTYLEKYGVELGMQSKLAKTSIIRQCRLCGEEFAVSREHRTICPGPHYRTCVICGEDFEVTKGMGSRTCCSAECTKTLRANTMQQRFGVSYSMENPELLHKAQQTTIEHYGVRHPAQSENVKSKMTRTCHERYGVDNYASTPEFKQKSRETCLRKYGVEYVTQTEEFKARGEQTCLEKYGVRRPMQSREIHQGMWNTRKNIKAEDGTPLDSSWEKLVYDFWKSIGLEVERNIPIQFEYECKMYTTYVDFRVNGILYEVKGKPYLEGYYNDGTGISIKQKLKVYLENDVVLISDRHVRYMFAPGYEYTDSMACIDLDLFNAKLPDDTIPPDFCNDAFRWDVMESCAQNTSGFVDASIIISTMSQD